MITTRPADPTYDDGLAFAKYVDIASEGGIRAALGRRFSDIVATAFMQPGHDLAYEHVVFAVDGADLVGMVSAFTVTEQEGISDLPLRKAEGSRIRRAMGLWMLGVFFGLVSKHQPGDFYVEFLGVDESRRGQGIGTTLLSHMENEARERGAKRFALDVSAKNAGGIRLYKRFGFTIESEWPRARFLPKFIYRMFKAVER